MTEGKHTPWHLEDGANSHVFDGRVVDLDGVTVAFVTIGSQSASLIAAAPELLETLGTARAQLIALGGDVVEVDGKIVSDAIQAAVLHVIDDAIAKATGAS